VAVAGTSGVLLAAKTARAHAGLSEAFSSRRVSKTYLTVCVGNPGVGVEIDEPIGRHPLNRQKMAVAAAELGSEQASMLMPKGSPYPAVGRPARSFVDTLAFDGKLSVVQVRIETGRTHQIRVHLQHRRTPVLGDELYGNAQWNTKAKARFGVERPMLHALTLELAHPVTMQPLKLTAPVPRDLMRVVRGVWPQVGEPGEEAPEWVGLSK
jgi:23S rRNA pseudouridine1911/1915/1917 synthase